MAKYEVDWADEVAEALGAPTMRKLQKAFDGKGGLSPGGLARLAEGLSAAATEAIAKAKATVELDQGKAIDCGVIFTMRAAYSRESVDTEAVNVLFPREENPDLYRMLDPAAVKWLKPQVTNPELYKKTEVPAGISVQVGPPGE